MFCLYQRPINSKTGKLEDNGDHWATFFCNGVNCRRLYHGDEAEVIKQYTERTTEKKYRSLVKRNGLKCSMVQTFRDCLSSCKIA